MAETYIINSGEEKFLENHKYGVIQYSAKLNKDWQFHDFVVSKIFNGKDIKSLIIPIDLLEEEYSGLWLGMHIRLNNDLTPYQRKTPLIFLSKTKSIESIFSDKSLVVFPTNIRAQLLLITPYVFLEKPVLQIIETIANLDFEFTEQDYFDKFIENIKVTQDEKKGKHSVANIWGVYQLAKTTNNLTALNRNLKLHQNFKELYFKFIQASSKVFSPFNDLDFNIITTKKINSPNKKVLYIDDEADKGWEEVLKSIFVGAEFESVGKMENESAETYYAKAKTKALEIEIEKNLPKWDLILLDLRLDETEDVGENAFKLASSYSGAKLLKEIKTGNKGNQGIQVIIFTASNKAWNMRELLIDLKADGFFVKESPEYNSDVIFSEKNYENFENQVIYCYNRSYLRSIFKILNPLKDVCQNELNAKPGRGKLSFPNTLVNDIGQSLNVFEELLIGHSSELNYAFGTLILTIESIVNEMYYDSVDDQLVSIGLLEQKCNFLKGDDRFLSITPVNDGKEYKKGEFRLILDEEISKYNKKVKFIPFNFRLACILHFKYGLKLDQSLFRFFKIYKLRSEHVFHKGSEKIDSSDLLLMLELLTIFLSK